MNLGPMEVLFMLAISAGFFVWPAWRICSKAGFPGALGLLIIVPLLNIGLLFFLAFAEWPSLRPQKAYGALEV
jgi:hypothetical protein